GVAWLVPEEAVYHCCDKGQNLLGTGPPLTPLPLKHASWEPLPLPVGVAIPDWGAPPEICVPGATMSGLNRPSRVGPRLEKLIMSLALFAPVSPTPLASAPPNA